MALGLIFIVMTHEDKIVELLEKSLKNQDVHSEKLDTISEKLEIVSEKLGTVTGELDSLVDVVKDIVHTLHINE